MRLVGGAGFAGRAAPCRKRASQDARRFVIGGAPASQDARRSRGAMPRYAPRNTTYILRRRRAPTSRRDGAPIRTSTMVRPSSPGDRRRRSRDGALAVARRGRARRAQRYAALASRRADRAARGRDKRRDITAYGAYVIRQNWFAPAVPAFGCAGGRRRHGGRVARGSP